jgi:hypothetical protein
MFKYLPDNHEKSYDSQLCVIIEILYYIPIIIPLCFALYHILPYLKSPWWGYVIHIAIYIPFLLIHVTGSDLFVKHIIEEINKRYKAIFKYSCQD